MSSCVLQYLRLILYKCSRFTPRHSLQSILPYITINIASLSHLLKIVDFNAIVDHLFLTHIIQSKVEPATVRIKRLLEFISSYSFNLCYIKGKDMVLSDFLSRQNNDDSNPHEIIPISFNMHKLLQANYYKR